MLFRFFTKYSPKSFSQQLVSIQRISSKSRDNQSTATQLQQQQPKEKWDLHAGVLIERHPIVSKTLKPIQKEFQQLIWQIEFENSLKSEHELRHEKDLIQAELIKKGEIELDLDDTSAKQTAQDLEDAYVEELKKFKPAPRITEEDKKNNLKSTNQKLEDTLYLIVEQKLGNKIHLILPQGVRQEGETMRQTAERVLKERCGNNLEVIFYGNAPCGFYKYKYPREQRNSTVGAKVFFFRAAFKNGNVNEKEVKNFEWVTQEDLMKKLSNKTYAESVIKFLI